MNRLLAALSFFTRIPFWRLSDIPAECYKHVVPLWPVAGLFTGGIMAAVLWLSMQFLPVSVSVVLALIARIILTGALHEDGFSDFCDGFGGGTNRERTLEIMKDSHIGAYGVIGLIMYFLLIYNVLTSLFTDGSLCVLVVLAADTFAKFSSSQIINILPYARKAEEAKTKMVYLRMNLAEAFTVILFGLAPCITLCIIESDMLRPLLFSGIASVVVSALMFNLMQKKIQGYTGDCCGATFIVTETVFYLTLLTLCHL